jgi:hypothetical protein
MSSRRGARGAEHREPWDGFVEFDRYGTLIQPDACREGHSLADVTGHWDGTFHYWHCPTCERTGVPDPVYRLRRRITSLT